MWLRRSSSTATMIAVAVSHRARGWPLLKACGSFRILAPPIEWRHRHLIDCALADASDVSVPGRSAQLILTIYYSILCHAYLLFHLPYFGLMLSACCLSRRRFKRYVRLQISSRMTTRISVAAKSTPFGCKLFGNGLVHDQHRRTQKFQGRTDDRQLLKPP